MIWYNIHTWNTILKWNTPGKRGRMTTGPYCHLVEHCPRARCLGAWCHPGLIVSGGGLSWVLGHIFLRGHISTGAYFYGGIFLRGNISTRGMLSQGMLSWNFMSLHPHLLDNGKLLAWKIILNLYEQKMHVESRKYHLIDQMKQLKINWEIILYN